MNKYIILIICAVCTFSCKNDHSQHTHQHGDGAHQHDHNKANKHMHNRPFEELVAAFEDPERESYQMPYEVINFFGNLNGKKIMDIGAGTGYFSFKLAEKGASVIAADVDDRFLDYIQKRKKEEGIDDETITLRKVPYNSPELSPQEVDGVIMVNTYHHIEERVPYFRAVKEGLTDTGMLMIVDFKKEEFESDAPGPPIALRIHSERILDELSRAGFTKVYVNNSMLPYQYIIRAFK